MNQPTFSGLDKKVLKNYPPLIDYPDEFDEKATEVNSEKSDVIAKKVKLEKDIKAIKNELLVNSI